MDLYQRIQRYTEEIHHFIQVQPYGRLVSARIKGVRKK